MDGRLVIQRGTSLLRNSAGLPAWSNGAIYLAGSRIEALQSTSPAQHCGQKFNAEGLLVLPGMVDLHGDAFERQIQPRPGTVFSHEIALIDTDRQLVTNGITTACHGVTFSWEEGLRGRDAALALMKAIARHRTSLLADHRMHLRFENHHLEGLSDALQWINEGKIDFFAFNEHLPSIAKKSASPGKLTAYAERARCSDEAFLDRLHRAAARGGEVPAAVAQLAAACIQHRIPMASHDDETRGDRERYEHLDVTISEFPKTREALDAAIALGNTVVMGAPNVLLGGSHCGGLSAADVVRETQCDVLTSDYFYPAMLHAAFALAEAGACTLAHAWQLVSYNPAQALNLTDRGRICEGCRADLVLVDASAPGLAKLIATIAAGKIVYCAEPERLHVIEVTALIA